MFSDVSYELARQSRRLSGPRELCFRVLRFTDPATDADCDVFSDTRGSPRAAEGSRCKGTATRLLSLQALIL
jgi:hypothetical protein